MMNNQGNQQNAPVRQAGVYMPPPASYDNTGYAVPATGSDGGGNRTDGGYQPIDKKILRQCRHKAERRWYRRLVVLNLLIIAAAIGFFLYAFEDTRTYAEDVYNAVVEEIEDLENAEDVRDADVDKLDDVEKEANDLPDSLLYLLEIVITVVAIPFVVYYVYAQYRSMSVCITPKTYPEIYAIVEEYARKLGMKKVPKIYMIQGNGVLNAFSTFIPFKQYIEIYADLLEVAYREYHDMDTIRFIIAHEIAHIYYKHATMHYYYAIMFSQMIPILGSTASRTREYSCDRLAQLLSGSDGIDAMMALTAGIHLYKQVDHQDYIEHARTVKGFFIFCWNLVCDHPITTKRVLALADPEKKSGKLY